MTTKVGRMDTGHILDQFKHEVVHKNTINTINSSNALQNRNNYLCRDIKKYRNMTNIEDLGDIYVKKFKYKEDIRDFLDLS